MTATTDTPTREGLLAEGARTAEGIAQLAAEIAELRAVVVEVSERVHAVLGEESRVSEAMRAAQG